MIRRKPDLMLVLAVLIGLGVIITGFTQELQQPRETANIVATR